MPPEIGKGSVVEVNDIRHRFTYHAPDPAKAAKHQSIRQACMNLAHNLNDLLPDGREKSLAITHLEEVCMWANASLARSPE
jgi:hypothetical protein